MSNTSKSISAVVTVSPATDKQRESGIVKVFKTTFKESGNVHTHYELENGSIMTADEFNETIK